MEAPMFTIDRSTPRRPTPLLTEFLALMAASRPVGSDRRVWVRIQVLTLGSLVALGRHTLSQVLIALGAGQQDWSAWYRVFNRGRFVGTRGRLVLVQRLLAGYAPEAPVAVVVDATQLPRSSRRFPGVGATRAPRCPIWRPGVHLAQRVELLSGLVARTAQGESRAIPVRATVLRSPRTRPFGPVPEQTEGMAAATLVRQFRDDLRALGQDARPVLVLGDGAYSTAPFLRALPERTLLLARCARNRALYAVPVPQPGQRGRKRLYGERGPTPLAQLTRPGRRQPVAVPVRGRLVTPRVTVTGPWLVKPVPEHPLFLLVVHGIDRGRGTARRQRDPHFFLVSAVRDETGTLVLPLPVAELLAWSWQRWEVEVMHRELKSSCGLGDQQAWSPAGAAATLDWALWTYALLILTGVAVWGIGPAPGVDPGRWWRPRRWSVGRLLQDLRAELWHQTAIGPGWRRSPDAWGEMETWITTQSTAALGIRHI
jgi:hypothetical protein